MSIPTQILLNRYAAGLTWRPLVTDGASPAVALARARDEKARMYVHDGSSAVVGLASLTRKERPKQAYAVALLAARGFPSGESIFAIAVEPQCWWVGASVNGMPVADAVARSQSEAWSAVERLQQMRGAAALYGDQDLGLPDTHPLALEQLRTLESKDLLLRDAVASLPRWSLPVAIALVGLLAYQQGAPLYKRYFGGKTAAGVQRAVDPVAAWSAATKTFLATVKAPMAGDLLPLRTALYDLPSQVGGWDLASVECVAATAWHCSVKYVRPTRIDSESTNRTFEDARPKGWTVAWQGATELTASFDAPGSLSTQLVPEKHVQPLGTYQIDTFSEFQELSKAFQKVEVPEMARAEIAPPMDQGKPVPRPAAGQVPEIFKASVAFTGPLRDIELLERLKAPVFWRHVSVTRAKAEKPGLLSSEFSSVMKGEIYAKSK